MGSEWTEISLEDAVAALIDYRGKTPVKTTYGVPLITAKVVKNGRIETPNEFISVADYESWMRRGFPKQGDVVITTEAPLGEVAQLGPERVALAQRLIALRGKPGELDNSFLKFLLQSESVQDQLRARASGSTVSGIKQSELRKISLILPPLPEQRAIAHILGTLDDKIELNRKRNETLEAMARALFKDWFVDFGPVRARMDGRDPYLPAEIWDLFPDRLDEEGKPEGWGSGSLEDIAQNQRRSIQPEQIENDTPYIALEHMPKRCIALSEWEDAVGIGSNKYEFKRGEILFGKLRPYFHKVGVAPIDGICSTDIVVVTPKSTQWFGLVLCHVSSDEFVDFTNAGSTGTKMPRTSWNEMSRYELTIPPVVMANIFNDYVKSWVSEIIGGIHENRTLAQLRDTLLPKLISGELRVEDLDKFLESTI